MINKIKTNIQNHYYQYTPGEFLPIFIEGEWANRGEFTEYKVRKVMSALDKKFMGAIEVLDAKIQKLYEL